MLDNESESKKRLCQIQGALMILEHRRVNQDEIIQRALKIYHILIREEADEQFQKMFPNSFSELKNLKCHAETTQ